MTLRAAIERLPLARPFRIARGTRTEQVVVTVRVAWEGRTGRGECTPYPRYDETPEGVRADVEAMAAWLGDALADGPGVARDALLDAMPPGAARNAVDCALWDLECKAGGRRAWEVAGAAVPAGLRSVLTVGIDAPGAMARAAAACPTERIKVKLGAGDGLDGDRLRLIRGARADAVIVVDANEGWGEDEMPRLLDAAREAGVLMVEQPLPQGREDALRAMRERGLFEGVLLCADESCRQDVAMAELAGTFDMVNLKLDKTGGLTHGLAQARAAKAAGLSVMVGCMLGSSLAMAPGAVLAQAAGADPVDLDGPTWLAADRDGGIVAADGAVSVPGAELWG